MKSLIYFLLLLPFLSFGQGFSYNQGGPVEKKYYSEIPFENIDGKLFLEVTIAGKKHRFVFDTGAPLTISKELVAQLKAKELHKETIEDAYLHSDSVTIVEANHIKVGDITFNGIPAVAGFPDLLKCYGIDGIMGSNLIRNSIVSIDNNRHLIIITNQADKLKLNEKNSAPLQYKEGTQSMPQIQMVMNNKVNVNIPFDTGDDDFIRVDDKGLAALSQLVPFTQIEKGRGASEYGFGGLQNTGDKYLYKAPPFTVGNAQFFDLVVETEQETSAAIGSKLLNYGTVTLDYINSKFYFDAYSPINDLREKRWPVKPTFVNNKYVIGVVWGTAKLLLKQGEQIMAVNDRDCSNITACDLIKGGPGLHDDDKAMLTLKNAQGEIRKVTIQRAYVTQ